MSIGWRGSKVLWYVLLGLRGCYPLHLSCIIIPLFGLCLFVSGVGMTMGIPAVDTVLSHLLFDGDHHTRYMRSPPCLPDHIMASFSM